MPAGVMVEVDEHSVTYLQFYPFPNGFLEKFVL